jgi:hypothetical protein
LLGRSLKFLLSSAASSNCFARSVTTMYSVLINEISVFS